MRRLLAFEVLSVTAFLAVAALALRPSTETMRPIDAKALATGPAEETWTGIFIGEKHVGFSVSRESPTAGGGRLYEQRASFSIGAMGATQTVVTAGTALTDPEGKLVKFDFLLSSPVLMTGRGEVRPGQVHVEVEQGGATNVVDVPVSAPPALSMTAASVIRGRNISPGDSFEVPYFDPITMSPSTMKVVDEAPEMLPNGEIAHWLRLDSGGIATRRLVDAQGATLREESALGLKSIRMTKAEAIAVDGGEAPDLVALAKVPLTGFVDPKRPNGPLALRVVGVDAATIPTEPGLQVVSGDVVTLTTPDPGSWPALPVEGDHDVDPTLSLPSTDPEMLARARDVVGDATDRATAAKRINEFVHTYVAKVPTIGIPNGLEVLHSARGDCNEHTALFVSLARAAGIPSRIAAGLVYSPLLDHGFYYHAWPEVELAENGGWIAVDPTFGQFPAEATHLKLVTGDLDRQIEIMSVMGKIKLEVVPAASTPTPPP